MERLVFIRNSCKCYMRSTGISGIQVAFHIVQLQSIVCAVQAKVAWNSKERDIWPRGTLKEI